MSQQVIHSGSSSGHKPDLFFVPPVHPLERYGKQGCQWRLREKTLLSTSAISSVVTSLLVVFIGGRKFSLTFHFSLTVEALLILCIPWQVQFQLHLGLLTSSLQNSAASSYSSQNTCPCFCYLFLSYLPFSLTQLLLGWSQLSNASAMPSFPDFLHPRIGCSWALWKLSLKICQLCPALLSLRTVSQGVLWI